MMSKSKIVFEHVPGIRISYVHENGQHYKGRIYHTAKNATEEYMLSRRHRYNDWQDLDDNTHKRLRARVMKVFKKYLP
jgi:hypothetical protein